MKHIESIQPEYAAEELERIVREEGDATASAALSRLLHDWTGCAIPPTADTPQSEVEELVPLCLSILRRHWTTPLTALGDGTTPMSLADLLRRLIGDRVQGNEAWSIPAIRADIPTAVAALRDRKIGGVPEAEDGMSIVHLMGDSSARAALSEFTDDNVGWELNTNLPSWMQKGTRFELGCRYATGGITLANGNTDLEEIVLPYFEGLRPDITYWRNTLALASGCPNVTRIYAPKLKTLCTYQFSFAFSGFDYLEELNVPSFEKYLTEYGYGLVGNCPSLKKLYAPKYTYNNRYSGIFKDMPALEEADLSGLTSVAGHNHYGYGGMNNCPELHTLKLGVLTACDSYAFVDDPKLVRLEIAGAVRSINFSGWNPTTAIANNLQQFLSNFKTYIAQRLTDNGSGLTLTLSQAVRDAIQQDPDIVNIITSKGWTISPAPSV